MLAILAAAAAATAQAVLPTPAPLVAAERAFAADGVAHGVMRSFLAHSTLEAIIIEAPSNAHESLQRCLPRARRAAQPAAMVASWAGIARSDADRASAYLVYLADDARVHTQCPPPAKGPAAYSAALSARDTAMHISALVGGAGR